MRKFLSGITVFFIILVTLTSCAEAPAYSMTGNSPDAAGLPAYIDRAVRAYYGVSDGGDITEYMLAGVKSVTVTRSVFDAMAHDEGIIGDGETLIDVFINGEHACGGVIEHVIYTERFDTIRAALDEYAKTSGSDWGIGKYLSYFSFKDPADAGLDRKAKTDMFTRFPMTTDMRARYVVDPAIKYRETAQMLQILGDAGLLDAVTVTSGAVDLSCLEVFVNLESVGYAGVEFSGAQVPVGVEMSEVTAAADVVSGMDGFDIYAVYER